MGDRHYPKIALRFRLWGQEADFAARTWWAAPRTGDFVLLGAGKDLFPADKNGDAIFKVVAVLWGMEDDFEKAADWQRALVMIEHVEGMSHA